MSELSQEQREELTRWAQSRTLPAGDVFRARLMLALADAKSWSQIEVELHTSRPTIARWKRRFEAQDLILAPDAGTLKGLRDRAMLAVLLGCGLRKSEVSALTFAHIQERDGRWCIVDLVGKHNRVRTTAMPPWVKVAIDSWTREAGLTDGHVFRTVNRGGRVAGERLGEKVVWQMLRHYATAVGIPNLAPHDLRRTCAKLCRANGGELEQIQMLLGHASVQTTEKYLGTRQNLTQAPNDTIKLSLQR